MTSLVEIRSYELNSASDRCREQSTNRNLDSEWFILASIRHKFVDSDSVAPFTSVKCESTTGWLQEQDHHRELSIVGEKQASQQNP